MPELAEIRAVVHEVVGEQTKQLSGEIMVNREALAKFAGRVVELEETVDGVPGDSERPGLKAEQKDDTKARREFRIGLRLAKFVGAPIASAVGVAVLWVASHVYASYEADRETLRSHGDAILVLKTRVDHGLDEIDGRQQAILEALEDE